MHSAMFYVRGQYRDEILAVTVLRYAVGSLTGKLTSLDVHLRLDPVVDIDGTLLHLRLDTSGMGTVFEELIRRLFNEEERSAVGHAGGQQKAEIGNADVKMTSRVVALRPDEAEVTVVADLTVTGTLGQIGRGRIQHVSRRRLKGGVHRGSREGAHMIPSQFDYHAPGSSLEEVLAFPEGLNDATVMSDGHSLLPTRRLRSASPANIVDLSHIPGWGSITEADGHPRIRPSVTETDLEQSAVVVELCRALLDTGKVIADPLLRNRARICGNVAHGERVIVVNNSSTGC